MRTRITATVAVLVVAALALTGLIIYTVESARLRVEAEEQADQEIAELRRLHEEGRDPTTAEPWGSAQDVLDVFLQRNVPAANEVLVTWVDGRARQVSAGSRSDVATDPAFESAVRGMVAEGAERTVETTYGEVLVTVQPLRDTSGSTDALVVATFLDAARADLHALMRTYAVVSLLSVAGIVALAAWQAGRLLAPIRVLNATARDITETDLSARLPVTGNDDITDLTRTANQMLDRLEAAFVGQRQFLDDAGHELKTPLTVLRGHLELLDSGDPVEVEQTRALLLDEVDRMSRLVGDLIVLAKSRRPDFLVPTAVGLERLTRTLLAKARALGDRDWQLDEVGAGIVVLDEQRITQAVLQLADNAVKHTDVGDVVAIGSSTSDEPAGAVTSLWVRDTGDGIPAEDHERVLERFGRSGVRSGDEGFGLGLSIVDAIARAHDGSVHIDSEVSRGTRVRIDLPAREAPWPRS